MVWRFEPPPGWPPPPSGFVPPKELEARSQLAGIAPGLDILDMGRDRDGPTATATTI
jgi:hypothetical protein